MYSFFLRNIIVKQIITLILAVQYFVFGVGKSTWAKKSVTKWIHLLIWQMLLCT